MEIITNAMVYFTHRAGLQLLRIEVMENGLFYTLSWIAITAPMRYWRMVYFTHRAGLQLLRLEVMENGLFYKQSWIAIKDSSFSNDLRIEEIIIKVY